MSGGVAHQDGDAARAARKKERLRQARAEAALADVRKLSETRIERKRRAKI